METVDMPFVKALIQNISTDISEDLQFSLTPSQVTSILMVVQASAGAHQSLSLLSHIQHSSATH